MVYEPFNRTLNGTRIIIDEAPTLVCPSCTSRYTPDPLKIILEQIAAEAKRRHTPLVRTRRKKEVSQARFNFCRDVELKYDANDCKYIPGLVGLANEGFLTPVYFNKRVLHKYMEFDEYRIDISSNTYGTILHKDWQLSFGLNRNKKLFAWLGDLDTLPLNEQQYFLSENIESDHDVASEFYSAQREAVFTDIANENRLLQERSNLDHECSKIGVKLFRYNKDITEILGNLIRPVNWNPKGVIHVVNTLNKLCVESINAQSLKKEILKLDKHSDIGNLRGLKLLQKWIELRSPNINAREVLKPFFVLYDFRTVLDHEMEEQSERQIVASCYTRLGVVDGNYELLYEELVKQITDSYNRLTKSLRKIESSHSR